MTFLMLEDNSGAYELEDGTGGLKLETGGYAATVLADTPVAYWRLGETSGTNANDEANTNDATYRGGYTQNQTGALTGDADKAVLLDGASGTYLDAPDHASLDVGDTFSIEFWFKGDGTPAGGWVCFKGAGTASVSFVTGEYLQLDDDATVRNRSTVAETGTSWHHYVVTHSSAGSKIWRDGADVGAEQNPVTFANTTQAQRIGCYSSSGAGGNIGASLDEVAIYGTVLSSAQVAAHYAAGTGA